MLRTVLDVMPAKWPASRRINRMPRPAQRSAFVPRIHVVFHRNASTATTCHHCNDAPCVTSLPDPGAVCRQRQHPVYPVRVYRLQKLRRRLPIWRNRDGRQRGRWPAAGAKMRSLSRAPLRRTGLRGQLPDSGAARNGRKRAPAFTAGKTNPLCPWAAAGRASWRKARSDPG